MEMGGPENVVAKLILELQAEVLKGIPFPSKERMLFAVPRARRKES